MIEPDLLYTVLCDEVRREDNGKLMLLGLFEQIAVGSLPTMHPGCCVVNKWCNGQGLYSQLTRFVDEDDRVIVAGEEVPFDLPSMDAHFTAVQMFAALPIARDGKLFVEVLLNGELKQRYALHVMSEEAAAGP